MILARLRSTFLAAIAAASLPAVAGQSAIEPALDELARIAATESPQGLAERALALSDAFAGERAALDAALDRRLAVALAPEAALLFASARMLGPEPSAARLAAALAPLLELPGSDAAAEALAVAAAKLCGAPLFKSGLDKPGRAEFLAGLLAVAEDASRAAELRLAAASSAHAVGGGDERRRARAVMLAFLDSGDPARRGAAALALADAGDEIRGALEAELARLAKLPIPEGALAASHLEREELRRLQERKFKELERSLSTQSLPPEAAELLAVLELVEDAHIEGDKWSRELLMNAALDGLLGALDEHSTFMEPEIFERFQQDLEAEYGGIGAYVGIDSDDGLFTITRPIYSGPAYKAGLSSEDKIVRIDDWPTLREDADTIIKRLKGKPGTRVKLYVWRRGMDPEQITRPTEDMAIEVTRAQIAIPAVASELLPGEIGLVQLNEFSRIAYSELRRELKSLVAAGARGIVFDLRGNPGGLLDEAVEVASLFLPKGSLVATTDSRVQAAESHATEQDPVVPATVPVCVLVNQFSASASEIVSGALQDHRWATIVGERTYGKGSVQQLLPLAGLTDEPFADENRNQRYDLGEPYKDENKNGEYDMAPRVKLTIARWLLPSGRSIHRELNREGELVDEGGVQPDVEQEFSTLDLWRLEQRFKLRSSRRPRAWVDEHWEARKDELTALAACDDRDWTRYPGFEEFYAGLGTQLPRDDVRALLREELRRRVQDERGKEFPQGDFVEDLQLQRAIAVLFEKLGRSITDVDEYQRTFRTSTAEVPLVAAAGGEVDHIQSLVARLQGGDELSPEELRQVQEFLASLEGATPAPNLPKPRGN